eukprot:SAG11_NODE_34777_length_270_cov_0.608187_1_plen_42_part_00
MRHAALASLDLALRLTERLEAEAVRFAAVGDSVGDSVSHLR